MHNKYKRKIRLPIPQKNAKEDSENMKQFKKQRKNERVEKRK